MAGNKSTAHVGTIGMTGAAFIAKWRRVKLTERAASQQHFLDLCALVGHPTPAEADPQGTSFTFERGALKNGGGNGWADVWKRGHFGWEYKGKHKNLDEAYAQLLKYRESLDNPPLLVVSDMDRIIIRTNFTNTPTEKYEVPLKDLAQPAMLDLLRAVFHDPERLRPGRTTQAITQEAAQKITDIAQGLRTRGFAPQVVARFLDRIVFSMFAEDVGLLPDHLFSRIVQKSKRDPRRFGQLIGQLFEVMASGGDFGADTIRYFNGDLFADVEVLPLNDTELATINDVAGVDWSAIDPSILGTLFERALDPAKRAQLGAHYTSRDDIETIVDPVVLVPLRQEWDATRQRVEETLRRRPLRAADHKAAERSIRQFLERLQQVQVLDPACGSGNFLYVVLQRLKDLEKEVILFGMDHGMPGFLPHVGPWQLHGIETNEYAFELAQMTVWIGWLQWIRANGFGEPSEPILKKLETFANRDAVLTIGPKKVISEPTWPIVDFIVSNPPFLGDKFMRGALGDTYVDALRTAYQGRVPGGADLCCYWFEKARAQVAAGKCRRVGLLATQGIRGGRNREVLERIKQTGDIFFAHSDRDWILDGANVHVSMVAFDDGAEQERLLDGIKVGQINANLTATVDTTKATPLAANDGVCIIGTQKNGAFDISFDLARQWLELPLNPNGRPNSDVLMPWSNGSDVTQRSSDRWIVDFGVSMTEAEAALYETPFEYLRQHVKRERQKNRREVYRLKWWLHAEPRRAMREAIAGLGRFIVTPALSKHRTFTWMEHPTLADKQLAVVARDDDSFLGILQSRVHELWARGTGTQLREVESGFRYTPSTCFETFPFPDASLAHRRAIGEAARELEALRQRWLNPPEWVREEVLEFPASVDGPWRTMVRKPNRAGIGTARYVRLIPKDEEAARQLRGRTLTTLYNEPPTWLTHAHRRLDAAVFAAYGWSPGISDEELLAKLVQLNLQRAGLGALDFELVDQSEGTVNRGRRASRLAVDPVAAWNPPLLEGLRPRLQRATSLRDERGAKKKMAKASARQTRSARTVKRAG